MTKPGVIIMGRQRHSSQEAMDDLSSVANLIYPTATDRASFLAECASGRFDGCVAAYRTFNSVAGLVDAELLSALPASLKFIAHNGAGYDQVDVPLCTSRGVRVSNVPKAVDDATADTNMFLLLGALRNFQPGMTALRQGLWRGDPLPGMGHDPQGKTLGILGMGGIGKNLARKAAAFDMKIVYHNRTRLTPESERDEAAGATWLPFDELLARSDVLSLNLPLNPHTRHIIGKAEFGKMKRGVVVVNTARGAVMDEAALVEALAEGQVGGAGLDVFEEEPKVHPGLLENPKVMLVPHLGTYTYETMQKMEEWTLANVKAAVTEGKLLSIVPEQKGLQ